MMTAKFGAKLDHAAADRREEGMKKMLYRPQTHDVFAMCRGSRCAAPGEHIRIWSAAPTGPLPHRHEEEHAKSCCCEAKKIKCRHRCGDMRPPHHSTPCRGICMLLLLWNKPWPRLEFRPHTCNESSTLQIPFSRLCHAVQQHCTIQTWYEITKPWCRQNKCIKGPMLFPFSSGAALHDKLSNKQ